mgnify:CR=1 FL=1|tara:strand:+ start:1117 stop:1530 length:414 start_codon:yes stop_codon:yes gene_type:complete
MAIFSAAELNDQAELSYVRGTYYIALLNSATRFNENSTYNDVTAKEVVAGTGGYARLSYTYTTSDLQPYSKGQPLAQKTAKFVHDGSSGVIVFTHVALLRLVGSTYSVVAINSVGSTVTLSSGNTAEIKIKILHGRP